MKKKKTKTQKLELSGDYHPNFYLMLSDLFTQHERAMRSECAKRAWQEKKRRLATADH